MERGPADDVRGALAAYRNEDGGFGHALEPDCRAPQSSALATWTALEVLREIDAPADDPLVQGGVGWLVAQVATLVDDGPGWVFLPPEAQHHPHAPWWDQGVPGQLAETFNDFRINPRASIVALLWHWSDLVPPELLDRSANASQDAIRNRLRGNAIHDHIAAARFAGEAAVPDDYRELAATFLGDVLPHRVATLPEQLDGYVLSALDVAPTSTSRFAALLHEECAVALDHLVAAQQDDGGWPLTWSWAETDPTAWALAEREWRGIVTLESVLRLRAHGRLG